MSLTDSSHAVDSDEGDVEVWCPSPEEWRAWVDDRLRELHVSYAELARQAHDEDYQSTDAKIIWMMVNGTYA